MYGHKKIFIFGWVWFSLWSLICGFCQNTDLIMFSTFRAFQGIGPALLIPNAIALIGRTYPVGLTRNLAFACFGAAGPTGAAVGAVFAALVSQTISWHWCFWLLSIVCAVLVVVSHFLIPSPEPNPLQRGGLSPPEANPPGDSSPSAESPTFDWSGALTGVTGLVLFNFALNQAPLVGWEEPYIGSLLGLGIIFLCAFVWVELFYASQPLIPIRGLHRNAVLALACVFAGWSSHGIWVYYLYIFLEHLRGHSALLTSAETCPVAITGLFFAFSTVWMLRRIPVAWVMLAAMSFFVLGSLLMALAPLEQTYWANTFVAVVLMPGAMNLSFPAATILLSSALPKEKQGIAASLVATMVNYSISCGLGFAGSIHKYTLLSATADAGIAGPPPPLSMSDPQLVAVRLVGLRAAYWFSVALGVMGMCIAALFVLLSRNGERSPGGMDNKPGIQLVKIKSGEQSPESTATPMMSSDVLPRPRPAEPAAPDPVYNHHTERPWV